MKNLSVKSMVRLAIFTVIFYLVIRISSMVSLIPGVYPFTAAITLIPLGIVWVYLRKKLPLKGSIFIQGVLLTILTLLGGSPYFLGIGMFIACLLAEFLTFRNKDDVNDKNIRNGYIAFGLVHHTSSYILMLVAKDYYISYINKIGMPLEQVTKFVNMVSWPMFLIGLVLAIICAYIGFNLGKKIVDRSFKGS
ncbi:MAG: MptD family putative ECF transporter S component [Peptoniphilus sp.]|uniref:MptD family putative ECF transporter S component n=1 Tax=Peptoniphilus sp. TaxID=1971214 RepID=UPI0025F25150|nr:MptD family putative ECF transporter S component [Peptoniphilus sp.]MCI5643487.1 MptD family putative ECF transporter S component [Peptoniphilus sp.]